MNNNTLAVHVEKDYPYMLVSLDFKASLDNKTLFESFFV